MVDRCEERRIVCRTLTRIREPVALAEQARRVAGDGALPYVDGFETHGPDDAADLSDELHPKSAGYARMSERFAPVLRRLSA